MKVAVLVWCALAAAARAHVDPAAAEEQKAEHTVCMSDLLPNGDILSGKSGCSGEAVAATGGEAAKSKLETVTREPTAPWSHISPCIRNGTAEFCVFHSRDFANGRGISIFTTPARAEHIAKSKAFSLSQDELAQRNKLSRKVAILPIPGKEYGVIATERIYRGERIISETGSLMVDYGSFDQFSKETIWEMQGAGVDLLPHQHRLRYLNMSTDGASIPHLEKIEKILNTNAFDVDIDDDIDDSYFVIFADTARMNHDCRPSVDYVFDPKTLTQTATASRDIMPGEELSLSYIDPLKPRHSRLDRLKKQWGFKCSCALCSATDRQSAESDARIRQIKKLRKEFADWTSDSSATPQMAELLISLYEQERLTALLNEAYSSAAMEYNGVGEPWLATKYARLALEYSIALLNENDTNIEEMRKIATDPWEHWSWMMRTRKRMNWAPKAPKEGEDDDDDDNNDDDDN